MPMTKIEVCNLALGHVPAPTIMDLDEGSVEANACALFFSPALENTLSKKDWKFASSFKTLSKKTAGSVPLGGWSYAYAYPANAIKIRELLVDVLPNTVNAFGYGNPDGAAYGVSSSNPYYTGDQSYAIGNRQGFGSSAAPEILFEVGIDDATQERLVYTDVDGAIGRFTTNLTNTSLWTPEFTMAFSWELAAFLALNITRDLERAKFCRGMAEAVTNSAGDTSDNETPQFMKEPAPSWIRNR